LRLAGDREPFDLVGVVEAPPGAITPRAEGALPIELDDAAHRQPQSAADVPWCEQFHTVPPLNRSVCHTALNRYVKDWAKFRRATTFRRRKVSERIGWERDTVF
jgi:hypothetical protein